MTNHVCYDEVDAWVREFVVPYFPPCKEPYFINMATQASLEIIINRETIPETTADFFVLVDEWIANKDDKSYVMYSLLLLTARYLTGIPGYGTPGALLSDWLKKSNLDYRQAAKLLHLGTPGELLEIILGKRLFPLENMDVWSSVLHLSHSDRLEMIKRFVGKS
jgi:hypothetical protein